MTDALEAFALYLITATFVASIFKQWGWGTLLPLIFIGALIGVMGAGFQLQPHLVMVFFLVPLVFGDALLASFQDLLSVRVPVLIMSVVPVILSCITVGWLAHNWIEMPWALAFALGAVLSPTDTVALKSLTASNPLPKVFTDIMQGEALLNDVTGLTAFHLAVISLLAGRIEAQEISLVFLQALSVGLVIGFLGGYVACRFIRFAKDAISVNCLILVIPFSLYALADHFDGSGILAIVVAALMIGNEQHRNLEFSGRVESIAIWEHLSFILEATAFFLMGMELRWLLVKFNAEQLLSVCVLALLIVLVLFATRGFCVLVLAAIRRLIRPELQVDWRYNVLLSWFGVRGPVSSMAAFAIPPTLLTGEAIPDRDLAVATAFTVIILTVLLSLTIKPLIRYLGVRDTDDWLHKEWSIWKKLVEANVAQLERWMAGAEKMGLDQSDLDILYKTHEQQLSRLDLIEQYLESAPEDTFSLALKPEGKQAVSLAHILTSKLSVELTLVERDALLELRNDPDVDARLYREMLRKTDIRLMFFRSISVRDRIRSFDFKRDV